MYDNEPARADTKFRVSLTGPGITVERDVDQTTALQIMTVVMGQCTQACSPVASMTGATGRSEAQDAARVPIVPGGERLSLREYFDEAAPKRNPDKILTIGAYLEDHRGHQTFGKDAVKREFRNAGEATPANYGRDFRWAVSNGWIAEATDVPGEYYVTSKGRQAISDKFSSEIKKSTSQAKGTRRRRRTRAQADEDGDE